MPNTEGDFWRMIWERKTSNIVMLTKCTEAGRVSVHPLSLVDVCIQDVYYLLKLLQRKCEQYWADNIGDEYQTPDKKFSVTTTSVMPFADFVIRTFSATNVRDYICMPI